MTSELVLPQSLRSVTSRQRFSRRVKVTYILGSLSAAGTERQALALMSQLDRERFSISLILFQEDGIDKIPKDVDLLSVLGIPQESSKWRSGFLPWAKAVGQVRSLLLAKRPDIVHAFLPGPSIWGVVPARLARVPVFIGSRRSLPSQYRGGRWAASWADTAAFRLAHFNLGNSEAVTREMIEEAGCPPGKCGTIHNGVDLERFRPDGPSLIREQMGWMHDEVVFGQVANFWPYKRHQDFVEMAAGLTNRHLQARFILAGADYGAKASILRQIDAHNLGSKIKVLDRGSSPEEIFAALDVYVCTSKTEGFSNVILEAMACAKPVIATDVGGNPEAVRHDQTGFLVPVGDVAALSQRAETLIADARLRKTMGMNGRRLAEAKFSLGAMVQAYQETYFNLYEDRMRRVA
jgi:glycosyltransferase involved in cell wall biosynthesis